MSVRFSHPDLCCVALARCNQTEPDIEILQRVPLPLFFGQL